jgi:hypothetical protein
MVSSETAIEALETRLRRLEFIITGSTDQKSKNIVAGTPRSIPDQLDSLNERLARIATGNKLIKKLLQACTFPLSLFSSVFVPSISFHD